MTARRRRPGCWAALLCLAAGGAVAEEVRPAAGLGLRQGGDVLLRLDTIRRLNGVNGGAPFGNSFGMVDLNGFAAVERLTVKSRVAMRQFRAQDSEGAFRDQGAFLSELQATLDLDALRLHAGKFGARFGRGNVDLPGLFGTDFIADYELPERLGVGLQHDITGFGTQTLAAELFTLDGSALSSSAFSRPRFGRPGTLRPWRFRGAQGAAGNDGQLDSVAVTLDGREMPGLEGFGYQIGWRSLPGRAALGERTEQGVVGSLAWAVTPAAGWTLTPMAEVTQLDHVAGGAQPVAWRSLAAELRMPGGTSAVLHGTERRVGGSGRLLRGRDRLLGASLAQDLAELMPEATSNALPLLRGLAAELGWKSEYAPDASASRRRGLDSLGVELRWRHAF